MALDAYAYGWQGGGSYGATAPPASPKYSPNRKRYSRPRSRPSNPRGFGPSKIFDPFGTPWGGVPKSPPAAGVAKALSKIMRRGRWERPMTSFGERAVDRVSRSAFEKAFAGWILTQATPQFDWWSPIGLSFGPQGPTKFDAITDPFQWGFNKYLMGGNRFFPKKKRRNRRRRR